jgi:serine/threonine-protein kinase PknK
VDARPASTVGLGAAPAPPRIPGVEDLEPIARGGYSVVYRGRQPDLGRDVAVKVLSSPVWGGSDAEQWRREITAMGRLSNHPNIVAAYAGGLTEDGHPYLVMPHVPEGSLGDRVRRAGPLSPAEVATMGAQLAGALASAHEAGVLHRDVKPDNVLLSPYGQPQLTDFGIARLLDATTTMTRTIHATVAYAAPEVLVGRPATEAADVYGLGATLFACLAGTPPFPSTEHDNVISLVSRIATQPPPDLRARGVPEVLAAVIEDALAKDPAERIPDAEELRRRLRAASAALVRSHDDTPPLTAAVGADGLLAARDEELAGIAPVAVGWRPTPPDRAPSAARPAPLRSDGGRVHRPVRRRRSAVVALAVLGLLVLGGVAVLLTNDSGDGGTVAGDVPTSTTTTPTEPPIGGQAPPDSDDGSTSMATAAERYIEAIAAGDLERSYSMLTPAFRAQQSRTSYEAFWSRAGPVEVVGTVEVDRDRRRAVVPMTIGGHGQRYALRFAQAPDGTWMVDGPRPGEG